ncbi:hypothetical protein HNR23_001704 [Nocardiopsis mwathae]|uniref:Uncharacterized protein n=1 Tax=Nocardiopsis mwathae TaxID=1472723 RepID=A0A7W9YGG1_9ACTN|nr:hypothetical protein [Nocardiopsis mwathae]MBB6171644.1 hypothetical protein [Nocardiopsis mwathae]
MRQFRYRCGWRRTAERRFGFPCPATRGDGFLPDLKAGASSGRIGEETLGLVRAAPIDVPALDRRRLAEYAAAHRNRRADSDAEDRGSYVASPARVEDVPTAVRSRWEVDYLRHVRTPYDSLLADLRGRVGRVQAELLLRRRVYTAIAARYPDLSAECDRQLARRVAIDAEEPP